MIHWNASPDLKLGPVTLHWYGLLFAASFLLGYEIMKRMYRAEGVATRKLDGLLAAVVLGTIVGARLGHTLFYEPGIYLRDPLRILRVWEGGLASHGAVLGVLAGVWIYCRKSEQGMLWVLDRLMLPAMLSAAFVRLGNLLNSEILGKPTNVPWAFVFDRVDAIPRHPAQLYESLFCFGLFGVFGWLYWKKNAGRYPGLLLGLFFSVVFAFRFVVEFFKANQEPVEAHLPLNIGQLLSLPMIPVGVYLVVRALRRGPLPAGGTPPSTGTAAPA